MKLTERGSGRQHQWRDEQTGRSTVPSRLRSGLNCGIVCRGKPGECPRRDSVQGEVCDAVGSRGDHVLGRRTNWHGQGQRGAREKNGQSNNPHCLSPLFLACRGVASSQQRSRQSPRPPHGPAAGVSIYYSAGELTSWGRHGALAGDVTRACPSLGTARRRRDSYLPRRTGSVNVNVEPCPTPLFTQIRPPCSSMNLRESASPSPVPSTFFSAVPTWRNSSKTAS